MRDLVVDSIRFWGKKVEIPGRRFISWLMLTSSKYYNWQERYGKINEHNGFIPRDFWLEDWDCRLAPTAAKADDVEGYLRVKWVLVSRYSNPV